MKPNHNPTPSKVEVPPRLNYVALLILLSVIGTAAIAISTNKPIKYTAQEWGLVTQLSPFYWAGLLLTGILVYLGRQSRLYLACAFGLVLFYLFVIPTIIAGHSLDFVSESFYKYREGVLVAKEGRLISDPTDPLIRYHNWPGFLFLSAFIYHISGVDSMAVSDYMAFFTIAVDGLLVLGILRSKLSTEYSLIGAMLFLVGFWTTQQQFHPQGMAYILYLTLFLIMVKITKSKTNGSLQLMFLFIVVFGMFVVTHPFSPILFLAGLGAFLIVSLLIRRADSTPITVTVSTFVLLATIFAAYWIYIAYAGFEIGIHTVDNIVKGDPNTSLNFLGRGSFGVSLFYRLTSLTSYLALAIIGLAALAGAVPILRGKQERVKDRLWLVWIVGCGIPGFLLFGHEGLLRSYIFGLVPLAYFSAMFVEKRPKLGMAVIITLLLLHLPAHYGIVSYMRTTPDTENAGTAFYVARAPYDSLKFYGTNWVPALWYHDPLQSMAPWLTFLMPPSSYELAVAGTKPGLAHSVDFTVLYEEANYIAVSDLQHAYFMYYAMFDPLEQLQFDNWSHRVYDNGSFRLYNNILPE